MSYLIFSVTYLATAASAIRIYSVKNGSTKFGVGTREMHNKISSCCLYSSMRILARIFPYMATNIS